MTPADVERDENQPQPEPPRQPPEPPPERDVREEAPIKPDRFACQM